MEEDLSPLISNDGVPSGIRLKQPLIHTISVRLGPEDMHELVRWAQAHGVGVTTMARMLIIKGLGH